MQVLKTKLQVRTNKKQNRTTKDDDNKDGIKTRHSTNLPPCVQEYVLRLFFAAIRQKIRRCSNSNKKCV